jgi:hypothetical protein
VWSALVGAAAIVGAYESTYTNAPSQLLDESPTAATTILFAAALGFLATSAFAESLAAGRHERREPAADAGWDLEQDSPTSTLDSVLAGEPK